METNHYSLSVIVRVAVCFALWVVMAACALWFMTIQSDALDKINKRLPESERLNVLFFSQLRFIEQYRRLYPDGKDLYKMYGFFLVGATALIISILVIAPVLK